mmetsp:Transcript_1339/g.2236  ORF Transcript_1339/g.2236 Transcript_1339/m.2236 type:complete len:242 (-) Transcript_1339:14-739(-)
MGLLGLLAPPDLLAVPDRTVSMELMGRQGLRVRWERPERWVPPGPGEAQAGPVYLATMGRRERMGRQALLASTEGMAWTAEMGLRDLLVKWEPKDPSGLRDNLDCQESLVLEGLRALSDHQAPWAEWACRVCQVLQDQGEMLGKGDRRVRMVRVGQQENRGRPVLQCCPSCRPARPCRLRRQLVLQRQESMPALLLWHTHRRSMSQSFQRRLRPPWRMDVGVLLSLSAWQRSRVVRASSPR